MVKSEERWIAMFAATYFDNYFASSDPHHDISKQLVDTTFV
jgi:predicted KAP-like P-loop ATPase